MSKLREARAKTDDLLNRQVPGDASPLLREYYLQLAKTKKENLEPLLKFIENALSIIPGFLLNSLLQKSEEASNDLNMPVYHDFKNELKQKTAENFEHEPSLRTLIHDTNSSYPPEGLNLAELQELYCRSVFYQEEIDLALDAVYTRMAKFTSYMPDFLVGPIAQLALTPYIGARVTEHLGVKQAAALVKYFKHSFLGELVLHLSAEKTAKISAILPLPHLLPIMDYMIDQQYYPHMAAIFDAATEKLACDLASHKLRVDARIGIIQFINNADRAKLIGSNCAHEETELIAEELKRLKCHHAALFANGCISTG